ncbi:hypothetical protein N9V13_04135 [Betaproteobacteria bacterium]|nr:hypothetical protein [Betaproteobacteria bacterium]
MNKRRSLLFAISGLFATLCRQGYAVKSFSTKKQILFLSYDGQKSEIPAHNKIVFIDLPPNKYFEIEAIDLDNASVDSKRSFSFRMPCILTKPAYFELKEKNLAFIIYPKGTPWPNKQPKTT